MRALVVLLGMANSVIRGACENEFTLILMMLVIVSVREFEKDRVDVIHKYSNDEVRELIKLKEIRNIHDDNADGSDGKIEAQIDFADSDNDDNDNDNVFGNNDNDLSNEIIEL